MQRVSEAKVEVGGRTIASIGKGALVFLGVEKGDTAQDLDYMVRKISGLRIFEDQNGRMNLSIKEIGGETLVVSQFTLAADLKKGNRPSFDSAEEPSAAAAMYDEFVKKLRETGVRVATGEFAAHMGVSLVNDGPVTIMLDSRR